MFLRNPLYQFKEIFIVQYYITGQYSPIWMYNHLFNEALFLESWGVSNPFLAETMVP